MMCESIIIPKYNEYAASKDIQKEFERKRKK